MTELTPVNVTAGELPRATDRPVVFHGVNKTGSLAMSEVIRDSYRAADRGEQFFSVYHEAPSDFEEFAATLREVEGHGFFVSHYIYERIPLPRDALLVGQIRHPLPRTLSVYGWVRRNYLHKHGTPDGLPTLSAWVRRMEGKYHTQMSQFAIGFPDRQREMMQRMPAQEMCARALENLHHDFAWFGCAELFEESIFAMAHLCGLNAVPPWRKDTRNRWRQSLQDTDEDAIELIRDAFAWEFEFYDRALATLRRRLDEIDFGPSIDGYRERCRGEYSERLTMPA